MFPSRRASDTTSQPSRRPRGPTLSEPSRRRESAGHTHDDITHPPRYSRLTIPEPGSEDANHEPDVFYPHTVEDGISLRSLGSNLTSPTYTTLPRPGYGNTTVFGESTITLSNPPGYSSGRSTQDFTRNPAPPGEFLSTIKSGGLKPRTWATLRLYDLHSNAQMSRAGRYPRYSDQDNILGNVELSLAGVQTIKSIKLVLKGAIITSSSIDGLTPFLEHTYTVWDRKSGDPRHPLNFQPEERDHKFDGKLEGRWLFPFSVPFPTHTDLSTLSAVYPPGRAPVPLQPQAAEPVSPITPFEDEAPQSPESPSRQLPTVQGQNPLITPFPMDPSSFPPEKVLSLNPTVSQRGWRSQTHITPFSPHGSSPPPPPPFAPGPSAVTPYTYTQRHTGYPLAIETDTTKGRSPQESPTSPNTFKKKDDSNTGFDANEGPPSGPSYAHNRPTFKRNISEVLPQSFLERNVKSTIQYELILVISHGKFSSDRVKTTIIYNPTSRPPPMPLSRKIAYEQRSILPNPMTSPEGWKKLAPVLIEGDFLHQRDIKVEYTLYLANPVSYSRGTTIPCYLTIKCDDSNALNLLANPRSPRVRLRRFIRFLVNTVQSREKLPVHDELVGTAEPRGGPGVMTLKLSTKRASSVLKLTAQRHGNKSGRRPGNQGPPEAVGPADGAFPTSLNPAGLLRQGSSESSGSESDYNDEQDIVNAATWWINVGNNQHPQEPGVRCLQGEIHLPKNLQPTCRFPLFTIKYRAEVLAPTTQGFEPDPTPQASSRRDKASAEGRLDPDYTYTSQRVEITTDLRGDEPPPIAYTRPPGRSDRSENTRLAQ